MAVRAGDMRHLVTFQVQSTTQDAMGQPTNTWTEVCERMVSVEPLNGRELLAASGEFADVSTRIRARYDTTLAALKPHHRIVYGSQTYDIESIVEPSTRGQELIFFARRLNG